MDWGIASSETHSKNHEITFRLLFYTVGRHPSTSSPVGSKKGGIVPTKRIVIDYENQ